MYRYETHLHTAEGSTCSHTPAAQMAEAYKKAGYDGIFVTDHFFNSSTTVPENLPWKERIELYCKGYEAALEEGKKTGLSVFFGVEFTVSGADFLLYGIDKEWMINNYHLLMESQERELFAAVRENGGFVVQAHPFREASYIPHISLYPRDVDGVEAVNIRNPDPAMNLRAKQYAASYKLPVTGGSDAHNPDELGGGILVPRPINSIEDYYEMLIKGEVQPIEVNE